MELTIVSCYRQPFPQQTAKKRNSYFMPYLVEKWSHTIIVYLTILSPTILRDITGSPSECNQNATKISCLARKEKERGQHNMVLRLQHKKTTVSQFLIYLRLKLKILCSKIALLDLGAAVQDMLANFPPPIHHVCCGFCGLLHIPRFQCVKSNITIPFSWLFWFSSVINTTKNI